MNPHRRPALAHATSIAAALLAGVSSLLVLLALASAPASAATVSPLPESDYAVRSACSAPEPGHAGCLALELVPTTSEASARTHPLGITRSGPIRASTPTDDTDGLRPEDLRDAYFPGESPDAPESPESEPQTIALVDAYNDPQAQQDLAAYEKEFGLNRCSAATSACFEQVNQKGETTNPPFPASETARQAELSVCENTRETTKKREAACDKVVEADGWAIEISTDIEVARAICQNCKILLVEANSPSYENLEAAEETAVKLGATEVSNSWGGEEPRADSGAFDHPGIVIAAAAGDDGYLNWTDAAEAEKDKEAYYAGADYPAASSDVIAVGGTKLTLGGGIRQGETVWNEDPDPSGGNDGAGGGGCSESFTAQLWQQEVPDWSEVGCGSKRAVADVSADADPYSGVAVYDSVPDLREEKGEIVNTPLYWWPIGGTSVASPIVASMFALAGGAHKVEYPAQTLYSHLGSPSLYDVTSGGNGECGGAYLKCNGSLNPRSPLDCGAGAWICNATTGYDGPTGVGAPNGTAAFKPIEEGTQGKGEEEDPLAEAEAKKQREEQRKNHELEEQQRQEELQREKKREEESKQEGNGSGGEEPKSGESTQGEAPSGAPLTTGPLPSAPLVHTATSPPVPILSAPALTRTATAALSHDARPKASQIAFAFTLNVAARVRATLAKLVVEHRRNGWQTLPDSLTIAGARGRNSARLNAHGALTPGRYRLTLAPRGGAARTLTFQVG